MLYFLAAFIIGAVFIVMTMVGPMVAFVLGAVAIGAVAVLETYWAKHPERRLHWGWGKKSLR